MALPLTLVFISALLIFKAGAFPPIDNGNSNLRNFFIFSFVGHKLTMFWVFPEAAVVVERSSLTSATTDLCLREGGLCVIKSQCPQDKLASKKGLCGKADKECCHSRNNNKSARTKFFLFLSNLISSQFHSFETRTIILSYLFDF